MVTSNYSGHQRFTTPHQSPSHKAQRILWPRVQWTMSSAINLSAADSAVLRDYCTQAVWGQLIVPYHLTPLRDDATVDLYLPFSLATVESYAGKVCRYLDGCRASYECGADPYVMEKIDQLLPHFPSADALWRRLHVTCTLLMIRTEQIARRANGAAAIVGEFTGDGRYDAGARHDAVLDGVRTFYKEWTQEAWSALFRDAPA